MQATRARHEWTCNDANTRIQPGRAGRPLGGADIRGVPVKRTPLVSELPFYKGGPLILTSAFFITWKVLSLFITWFNGRRVIQWTSGHFAHTTSVPIGTLVVFAPQARKFWDIALSNDGFPIGNHHLPRPISQNFRRCAALEFPSPLSCPAPSSPPTKAPLQLRGPPLVSRTPKYKGGSS